MKALTSIEICAGAGGQALGLELAGFEHLALVELDRNACDTLRKNRPSWPVFEMDVRHFSAKEHRGHVDLVAGGVPCPPFSIAGKQLGHRDERDLFPELLRVVEESQPKAVLAENVRGLLSSVFDEYRANLEEQLLNMGFTCFWHLLNASDFGVPQLRPRAILVALKHPYAEKYEGPVYSGPTPPTVGKILYKEMASRGWKGVEEWKVKANRIAPTIVGGSKRHGGPDLGPTRSKKAWEALGVDGHGIADEPPAPEFEGNPRLTVRMAALLQGFPPEWEFVGRKTPAYRQVGNAFPPPVAEAVGRAIRSALIGEISGKGEHSTLNGKEEGGSNEAKGVFLSACG